MHACAGERCEFNFGARPLAFPLEGHRPLMEPPPGCDAAAYLLACLNRLVAASLANRSHGGQHDPWVRLHTTL